MPPFPSSVVTVSVGPELLLHQRRWYAPACGFCGGMEWEKDWRFKWTPGSNVGRKQLTRRCLQCGQHEVLNVQHGADQNGT